MNNNDYKNLFKESDSYKIFKNPKVSKEDAENYIKVSIPAEYFVNFYFPVNDEFLKAINAKLKSVWDKTHTGSESIEITLDMIKQPYFIPDIEYYDNRYGYMESLDSFILSFVAEYMQKFGNISDMELYKFPFDIAYYTDDYDVVNKGDIEK